jgi:hypothetical protein
VENDDWERALGEFRKVWEQSLRRGEATLGHAATDAGALERLRRASGAVGESLRRAETDLRGTFNEIAEPRFVRVARVPMRDGARLTPEAFRFGTLGR